MRVEKPKGGGSDRCLPTTPFLDRDPLVSGMPTIEIVRSTHTFETM
jgi:hypothetical protein